VLCLGLNACDHLLVVPEFPARGSKLRVSRAHTGGGGQAATAACCLARLGWRVAYAGVCGDDEAGRRAEPWLREFGVEPAGLVVKAGEASQEAFILVEESGGERTILWRRGEGCTLEPGELDPGLVAGCRVLHLDGHFLEASVAAARVAREHGALVSLDGERVEPGSRELAGLCDVVVGSRRYPERLTGLDDAGASLRALADLGPAWAGRTLGPGGAEMLAAGRRLRQPAFAVEAVDTTGAGDVFHAGLVHALLLGQPAKQALATACAVAALSLRDLGGRSALPTREEVQRLLAAGR
jgi:ribokinase